MAFESGVQASDLDWIGIIVAMVAAMALGFLWYSPKTPTGRIWMKALGIPMDMKPEAKKMALSMVIMVIGTFLTMYVLMHVMLAFTEGTWIEGGDALTYGMAAMGAFFTWLGFYAPVQVGVVAWEGKSWGLFFVNTLYSLVNLMIAGMVFAWRLG